MPPPGSITAQTRRDAEVLEAIRAHADPLGRCAPGKRLLASDLGVSTDTIRRSLARLEAAGRIIITERQDDEHGGNRAPLLELTGPNEDTPPALADAG